QPMNFSATAQSSVVVHPAFMASGDLLIHGLGSGLHQAHDLLDDAGERPALFFARAGGTLSPLQLQASRQIGGALEEDEPAGLTQVPIDGAALSAEGAVDRHVERRGLPVHGAAAA